MFLWTKFWLIFKCRVKYFSTVKLMFSWAWYHLKPRCCDMFVILVLITRTAALLLALRRLGNWGHFWKAVIRQKFCPSNWPHPHLWCVLPRFWGGRAVSVFFQVIFQGYFLKYIFLPYGIFLQSPASPRPIPLARYPADQDPTLSCFPRLMLNFPYLFYFWVVSVENCRCQGRMSGVKCSGLHDSLEPETYL